jgi:hypothetical protein
VADTKISALTAASAAATTNELAINEAGTSKKLTVGQIKTLFGNGTPVLVVAASNSSAKDIALADYVCDGTGDEVQVQAACDALTATNGGVVVLAPGSFVFAAAVTITANKRLVISGDGSQITLGSGITGIKINQTSGSGIRGVHLRGLRIIGTGAAGTNIAVLLEDTNNSTVTGCYITDCLVAIDFHSNAASAFVEGTLLDDILIRDCGTGWRLRKTSGTGSFMQTVVRDFKAANCTTGVDLQSGGVLMRSHVQGTTWIATGQTGWNLDGNLEDSHLYMGVEGEGGATGNTGISFGTNASQTEQAFLHAFYTGTIATQMSNAFNKDFTIAISGSTVTFSTGFARIGYRRHGDASDRLRFEAITGGGRISWSDGTAAIDTNLYRSAADTLKTDDRFDPATLNLQTKAGVPSDSDIVGTAADGDIIQDTTNSRLYVRSGGSWLPLGQTWILSRGGTVLTPSGAINVIVWRAPFACTVTNVRGYRVGGTGATINARLNGSSNHLSSALSLTSADTWMDGGSVQNTAYAAGDKLEIMVVTVAGSPTQVAIQVDLTRP